jgi:hypothetical protein
MRMEITTCQICGRAIKAKRGLIAHHGYQRPGGWQTASCFGARHEPFQVSAAAIPPYIQFLKESLASRESWLIELRENPPEKLTVSFGMTQTKEVLRPEGFSVEKAEKMCTGNPWHYDWAFHSRVWKLIQEIKEIKVEIPMFETRLASWRKRD